ncbi:SpaH/EbpB family LPXTG-anchored major pilin [Ligilactobacillus murinus]|uniref:SpaH/EbpB family LPXTG-anchored major pilin n=1 Tax=Ligilactobacillus murinus TaxID=1622 RepID=UPI00296B184E|nr:SpaH/EbpB family LPXTG-anchored major pilin [Ligilactobacillus murinus]WOY88514.1 SpaH/EbpB family LPXTG-anchored major pilin [Ligilactobacillus murinus]
MKNKLKALFMSLLLVASVLIPSLASAKTVNADENIPENVNITVHKRVFKDGELPENTQNTGELMPNFGGEALPNVGFTVYDITNEYIEKLTETKDAQEATAAMVSKYTDAKPAIVAAEQKLTDKNGDVTFEGLATKVDDKFKTYIVLETKSSSAITTKAAPMVLTMPMYAYDSDGEVTSKVLENIHVYPKNVEAADNYEGKLTKELLDDTVHHHTNAWGVPAIDDMILSPRVGRLLQYKVTYNVPATTIFDADNGLTIVDDPGIGIVLPAKVAKGADGKAVDTIVDSLNSDAQVDNVVATYNGKTVDAKVEYHENKIQGGNSYFEMKITGEQNADLAGETLEITYYGYLAKTEASMDKPVDNKITVTADTTKGDQTSTEGETTRVATPFALRAATVLEKTAEKPLAVGGYNFQKIDAQSGKALEGAKFVVLDTETDNPEQSGYVKFNESANGRNDLKWVKDSSDATVYTSDANGKIELDYLPYGEYKLIEIEAPTGYAKGKEISFTVAKGSYNETKKSPAVVKNAKKGLLPSTGGYGIYIFLVIGLALMGGAYVWFCRVRKNDNV